jgi:hypothetical protein
MEKLQKAHKKSISSFVLMCKKNGELIEGYRISFLDNQDTIEVTKGYAISLTTIRHDGWLLCHPEVAKTPMFFNRECEKWFEVLGEL